MGLTGYILTIFLLFGLNFLLVYYIRNEQSFVIWPSLIYTILFLCCGAYLIYMVNDQSPASAKPKKPVRKKVKTMNPGHIQSQDNAEQYTLAQANFEQKEKESRLLNHLEFVLFLVTILGVQSLVAGVSAFIGARIIPIERMYFFRFVALYGLLSLFSLLSGIMIYHKFLQYH